MAGTLTKSLRISRETLEEIEHQFRGRDFSSAANELLTEALKMRRCPGIIFADGPAGRRARVSGTGIDVWEIVAAYESLGRQWSRLAEAFHWLSETQLRAALGYYKCYPAEIEGRIRIDDTWSPETVRARYPFTHGSTDEVLPRRRLQSKDSRDRTKGRRRRG
jgi:uncharacterized protein (DUF433 family)